MTIEIEGLNQLSADLKKFSSNVESQLSDVVSVTALDTEAGIVKGIQRGTKSGTEYLKENPKRLHQASAPGEAPASDTGTLVKSYTSIIKPLFAFVGSPLAYAFDLEFGTQRIKERPIVRPVREQQNKLMPKRVLAALKKVKK